MFSSAKEKFKKKFKNKLLDETKKAIESIEKLTAVIPEKSKKNVTDERKSQLDNILISAKQSSSLDLLTTFTVGVNKEITVATELETYKNLLYKQLEQIMQNILTGLRTRSTLGEEKNNNDVARHNFKTLSDQIAKNIQNVKNMNQKIDFSYLESFLVEQNKIIETMHDDISIKQFNERLKVHEKIARDALENLKPYIDEAKFDEFNTVIKNEIEEAKKSKNSAIVKKRCSFFREMLEDNIKYKNRIQMWDKLTYAEGLVETFLSYVPDPQKSTVQKKYEKQLNHIYSESELMNFIKKLELLTTDVDGLESTDEQQDFLLSLRQNEVNMEQGLEFKVFNQRKAEVIYALLQTTGKTIEWFNNPSDLEAKSVTQPENQSEEKTIPGKLLEAMQSVRLARELIKELISEKTIQDRTSELNAMLKHYKDPSRRVQSLCGALEIFNKTLKTEIQESKTNSPIAEEKNPKNTFDRSELPLTPRDLIQKLPTAAAENRTKELNNLLHHFKRENRRVFSLCDALDVFNLTIKEEIDTRNNIPKKEDKELDKHKKRLFDWLDELYIPLLKELKELAKHNSVLKKYINNLELQLFDIYTAKGEQINLIVSTLQEIDFSSFKPIMEDLEAVKNSAIKITQILNHAKKLMDTFADLVPSINYENEFDAIKKIIENNPHDLKLIHAFINKIDSLITEHNLRQKASKLIETLFQKIPKIDAQKIAELWKQELETCSKEQLPKLLASFDLKLDAISKVPATASSYATFWASPSFSEENAETAQAPPRRLTNQGPRN
ncbi:MAG TPA: hypothetical protein VLI69_07120 [Gammaproteobacteria bacterium]|nr:hypothetical protein [Gammaproteobacteria bacterium]